MMKKITILIYLIIAATPLSWAAPDDKKPCIPCAELKNLQLPELLIHTAEQINTGDKPDGKTPVTAAYCKVLGTIGKAINFELLLPVTWNGRFAMSGGGGFVGTVSNNLRAQVSKGFATAGTDTGHSSGDPSVWAYNNIEAQLNFGYMSIHRTTVVSKTILSHFYCSAPAYSYFVGTSRGGGQAMIEAQRFPDDFDGIVAGAPAFNWVEFSAKFVQNTQKIYPDPTKRTDPVITKDNLKLLQKMILQRCDALDGVRDSILNDPRTCDFDIATIPRCANEQAGPECITQAQFDAIQTIYKSLANTEGQIHAGFPFGGEDERGGWDAWIVGSANPNLGYPSQHAYYGIETFKYLIMNDRDWDYSKYDFTGFSKDTRFASAYLDATNMDYSTFKNRSGKMLIWQGWADPALSALDIVRYYEQTEKKDPSIRDYLRLYMLPGVLHGGGQGPDRADWFKAIQDWVEKGIAPERIVASKTDKTTGKTLMTRPVFPYPRKAVYDGKGNVYKESSFKGE